MNKKFLFLGCGKMGGAILQNFVNNGVNRANITSVDPSSDESDFSDISEVKNEVFDVVIFAIKPQGSKEILENFVNSTLFYKKTLFISILAGKKVEFFENILGLDKKIIRLMPNLPILVGEGISGYFCNKNVLNGEEKVIIDLFGENLKLSEEGLINQVTAISGSGPAYFFLFAKTMIDAGKNIGLSEADSLKLVKKTMFGAAKMLENERDVEKLIQNVASKGGTTEAALNVFKDSDVLPVLSQKAVEASYLRSKKLSKD